MKAGEGDRDRQEEVQGAPALGRWEVSRSCEAKGNKHTLGGAARQSKRGRHLEDGEVRLHRQGPCAGVQHMHHWCNCADKQTEAQQGEVICSRSHSYGTVQSGLSQV